MSDQMAGLRHLIGARHLESASGASAETSRRAWRASPPLTLAVASGKGGVGKTLCAAHLAASLARAGQRTLLVEGDVHMANLHLLFPRPVMPALCEIVRREGVVSDFLFCPLEHLDALTPAAASAGESAHIEIYFDRVLAFARSASAIYQFVVYDTASGMPPANQALLRSVAAIMVLSTPEIASITDAYAFVKLLCNAGAEAKLGLVPSMVSSSREARELHGKFNLLVDRFLGRRLELWGYLPHDARLCAAIAEGRLLGETESRSPYLAAIGDLADTLIRHCAEISGAQLHVAG